jgi:hypothetical protein
MMTARDELAALLLTGMQSQAEREGWFAPNVGTDFELSSVVIDGDLDLLTLADAILAQYRVMGRFKCYYKAAHDDKGVGEFCCGFPVIPWDEESVR